MEELKIKLLEIEEIFRELKVDQEICIQETEKMFQNVKTSMDMIPKIRQISIYNSVKTLNILIEKF